MSNRPFVLLCALSCVVGAIVADAHDEEEARARALEHLVQRRHLPRPTPDPLYTVVQVSNVFNNPLKWDGPPRWIAFERPQVIFQYFNGRTGDLQYVEAITAN